MNNGLFKSKRICDFGKFWGVGRGKQSDLQAGKASRVGVVRVKQSFTGASDSGAVDEWASEVSIFA